MAVKAVSGTVIATGVSPTFAVFSWHLRSFPASPTSPAPNHHGRIGDITQELCEIETFYARAAVESAAKPRG